jgi:hypothetical protein
MFGNARGHSSVEMMHMVTYLPKVQTRNVIMVKIIKKTYLIEIGPAPDILCAYRRRSWRFNKLLEHENGGVSC